eukprot:UN28628
MIDLFSAADIHYAPNAKDGLNLQCHERLWQFTTEERSKWVNIFESIIEKIQNSKKTIQSLQKPGGEKVTWDKETEAKFRRIWKCCYPKVDFPGEKDKKWRLCGFQNNSPISDIRGAENWDLIFYCISQSNTL